MRMERDNNANEKEINPNYQWISMFLLIIVFILWF